MAKTPTIEETRKEKDKLIKLIAKEMNEHGLVDLTSFINNNSSEGFINNAGFVRSVAYKIEAKGYGEVIPRKEWEEFYIKKYSFFKTDKGIITIALVSAILGFVLKCISEAL